MSGSVWLIVVGVLVAVNPTRLVGRLPATRVTAVGAALSSVVFVAIALIASRLLESIDVSAPTMRVAAGMVLVGAGVRDLLVGPPSAEPSLRGWGAAVVPVAIPMVARPQVGVLSLSAGSVEGAGAVMLGAVLAGAVVVGVAVAGDQGVRPRLLMWMGHVGAVIAVAVGVSLAVSGVIAV